ncbi:MAG: CinA family protein [bacterium]
MAKRIEEQLGGLMKVKNLTLAVAESCTGGLVGHTITQVGGSSDYFLGGVIAYSNSSKINILGVKNAVLRRHGAVSKKVASAMAEGVKRIFNADIGLSTTGIAGPSGGSKSKPVGLVYVGLAGEGKTITAKYGFKGTRHAIKTRATKAALAMLCKYVRAEFK